MHFRPHACPTRSLNYWAQGQSIGWTRSLSTPGCNVKSTHKDRLVSSHHRGTRASGYATVSSANVSHDGKLKEDLIEEEDVPASPPKYPYPTHKQPTPHEIFHLQYGASQAQIKSRYFELVRIHHPDSMHVRRSRLGPQDAHTRFRNIKAAYDFLQGRTLSPHPNARPTPEPKNFDPYLHELARRRRSWDASRGANRGRASFDEAGTSDAGFNFGGFDGFGAHPEERGTWNPDGRRERFLLWAGVMTLIAGLFPSIPGMIMTMVYPVPFVPLSTTATEAVDPLTARNTAARSPSASPFPSISLTPSLDKTHFAAAKALSQARTESREMGVERREGIRQRVKELTEGDAPTSTPALEKGTDLPELGADSKPPSSEPPVAS